MSVLSQEYDEYLSALNLQPRSPYVQLVKKGKGFLGFRGKHIYTVQMGASKIIDEDQYAKTQVMAVLDKVKNSRSSIGYLSSFSRTGALQFQRYANAASRHYKHHAPQVAIASEGVDKSIVANAVQKDVGVPIELISYNYMILEPVDWCKYQAQLLYGYDIGSDMLLHDGQYYDFSEAVVNLNSTYYQCTVTSIAELKRVTETSIIEDVTSKDANTDIVTTTRLDVISYYRQYDDELLYTAQQQTVTGTREVPKNSVGPSMYISGGNVEYLTQPSTTFSFNVPLFDTTQEYYLAEYLNLNDYHTYYWIYNPATNVYPELSGSNELVMTSSMYPTTIIRGDFSYVTGSEKTATEHMLSSLGLNLDTIAEGMNENEHINQVMDCFLVLGVSPSQDNEVVSKVLYETLEHVYDTSGLRVNAPYSMMFKQDMYNSTVMWTATAPMERQEKILPVGQCAHVNGYQTVSTNYYAICNAYNVKYYQHYFTCDVKVRYVEEYRTNSGILSRDVIKTRYFKNVYFNRDSYAEPDEDWVQPSYVQALRNGTIRIAIPFYVEVPPDEYGNVDYTVVYRYVEAKLTFDGLDCISNTVEWETRQSVVTLVTKQINAKTTRTHVMLDFIGNYSISHPRGVSVVALNGNNQELVIPILKKVYSKLSVLEKTKILDDALYFQHYAYSHQYLKWYETGTFGGFLKFVGAVIMICSMGSASNLSAALWALAKAIVIAVGVSLALELIAKYTDGFLQTVLSVGAIVVGVALNGGFTDFGFTDICMILNTTVEAFNLYVGEQMTELQDAMSSFNSTAEARLEDISEAWDSLKQLVSAEDYMDIVVSSHKIDAMLDAPLSMRTNTGLVEELTFFSKYNNPTEVWLQEVHTTPADKLHF